MADLRTVIEKLRADQEFASLASDVRAQFGAGSRQYLGATLLPERLVEENAYREESVRFRHGVIANAATRYSPVQMKDSGELVASFLVELGESDKGSELTSRDYDGLIKLLDRSQDMEAVSRIMSFIDNSTNVPLLEFNEKTRWEAIVDASVIRSGDGFSETVAYANPTGSRVAAGGTWSNDTYDPWADLIAIKERFADLGYAFDENNGRFICSTRVANILLGNDKIKQRVFGGTSQVLGTTLLLGSADRAGLDSKLRADGMPGIETYDLRYRTQTGTARFLKDDVLVAIAGTDQNEEIDLGDGIKFLSDTLGYMAIGRTTGEPAPGRVILVENYVNKPPRIETEAWQTSLPVPTLPEAIATRFSIA